MSGKNLKVNLIANTSQFKSAMTQTSNQIKLINSEFKKAAAETDKYGNKLDLTGAKKKQLNGIIDQYKIKIKAITNEQKLWTSELKKGNITESDHANKQQELARRLNNTEAQMKKYEGQLKRLNNEGKKTTRTYAEFNKQFRDVGTTIRNTSAQAGIASGIGFYAMKRAMGDVVSEAMSLESGMSKVKAISGATADEMKAMEAQALELNKSTVFTAEQAAAGMEKLALAGWKSKDIMSAMPGMLDLAAAGALELSTAADITSDTMQAFGLSADKAAKAADVFAYAQANANTNVEQMGEAMNYLAPTANSLGWTLEESAAVIMKLADSGLKGSMATQAFGSSLVRLSAPTPKASKLIKKLGLEFFDAEGKMKTMPEVIHEMEKGLKGMSDEQKAATMDVLVGKNAFKQWQILLESGSKTLATTTEELRNADGAAKDMAETMLDNAEGATIRMQSALSGLKIEIGNKLLPVIVDAAEYVTELANTFSNMDEATMQTIAETALLITALLGVTTAVAGIATGIGALMAFAGPVGLAITAGTLLLGGLAVAINHNANKTKHLEEAQAKAAEEAVRYGEGLSEGTRKGVKGYNDLYEGAKLKMLELKNMSGEEAEATKGEIVKAFADMGNAVVTVLEEQKNQITKTITEIYSELGEAGMSEAQKMSKRAVEMIDKDIAQMIQAQETIAKGVEKYGGDVSKMPPKVAKAYQEAIKVVEDGTSAFAATQKEVQSIQKQVSENQGKIQAQEAEGFIKRIQETYKNQVEAANQHFDENKAVLDKHLALYPEFQTEYDTLMTGLHAKTDRMMAQANQNLNDNVKILENNLDDRGKLLDIKNGEELNRLKISNENAGYYGKLRDETDAERLVRWQQHNQDYITALDEATRKSLGQYEQQLVDFMMANGTKEEEARRTARTTVEGMLEEMGKGGDKAKQAGIRKGEEHILGLESTKQGNERAGVGIVEFTTDGLEKGKPEAKKQGEEKGKAHKDGISSTQGENNRVSNLLSDGVTSILSKTSDGGGGKKAGSDFSKGVGSQQSNAKISAATVASGGLAGLKSVKTNSAGTDFVSGFRFGISSGSVWNAAWNLGKQALSALKKSIDSHSPSKEAGKEGKNFGDGFSGAIQKSAKQAAAAAKKLGDEALSNLQVKFDTKKIGADKYITELKKVQKQYKLTSDQSRKIEKEMYKASNSKYKQNESYLKLIDKVNGKYYKNNEKYYKNVKKINDQLTKDIKKSKADYDKELEKTTLSIYNQTGLFDKVETKKVDKNILIENLKAQNKQVDDFKKNLNKIKSKGASAAFIKELKEMGVGSSAEIEAISQMSKVELKEYEKQRKVKLDRAKAEANEQMKSAKQQLEKDIKSLKSNANKQIQTAKTEWTKGLKDINKDLSKFTDFKSSGIKLGKDTVAGLIVGLKKTGELKKTSEQLGKTIEREVKKSLKIKSPSQLMENDVSYNVIQGVNRGILKRIDTVKESSKKLSKAMVPEIDGTEMNDFKKAFSAISLAIEGNKQKLEIKHTIDKKIEDLLTIMKSEKNESVYDLLVKQNEFMQQQINLLMQLLQKDNTAVVAFDSIYQPVKSKLNEDRYSQHKQRRKK